MVSNKSRVIGKELNSQVWELLEVMIPSNAMNWKAVR